MVLSAKSPRDWKRARQRRLARRRRATNPLPKVLDSNVPTDEKWSLGDNADESSKVLTRREAQERAEAEGMQNFSVKFWNEFDKILTRREAQERAKAEGMQDFSVKIRSEFAKRARADGIQNVIVKLWKDFDEVLTKREAQERTIQLVIVECWKQFGYEYFDYKVDLVGSPCKLLWWRLLGKEETKRT